MTEHRKPLDHALDLLVYAPLGFCLDARQLLPQLVDRGRQQLDGQVTMAKVIGQFAVQQGQVEGEKRLVKVQEQAASALGKLGLGTARTGTESAAPVAPAPATNGDTGGAGSVAPEASPSAPAAAPVPAPSVDSLAVPDYDSLAASQVIPRLAGLSVDELELVRAYEAATRGRKTILNKIAQLEAG